MSEESLTLYKLMILFMLDNLDFPLTNSQLSEFFVNHGYTSYFHLQQAINELVESEFVRAETIPTTTLFPQEKKHSPCSTLRFPSQLRTIFSTTLPRKNTSFEKKSILPQTTIHSKRNVVNIW